MEREKSLQLCRGIFEAEDTTRRSPSLARRHQLVCQGVDLNNKLTLHVDIGLVCASATGTEHLSNSVHERPLRKQSFRSQSVLTRYVSGAFPVCTNRPPDHSLGDQMYLVSAFVLLSSIAPNSRRKADATPLPPVSPPNRMNHSSSN